MLRVWSFLQEARKVTGQPIVTELMNNEHIPLFLEPRSI